VFRETRRFRVCVGNGQISEPERNEINYKSVRTGANFGGDVLVSKYLNGTFRGQ